jgi:hypothetical protein
VQQFVIVVIGTCCSCYLVCCQLVVRVRLGRHQRGPEDHDDRRRGSAHERQGPYLVLVRPGHVDEVEL